MKILDTSVLVDLDRGGKDIKQKARKLDEEGKHLISIVSVTELYFELEQKYQKNTQEHKKAKMDLEKILSRFQIKDINRPIAIRVSKIMSNLKNRELPLNNLHDIYIGATALTEQLVVLTANLEDYERIEKLEVQDWKTY